MPPDSNGPDPSGTKPLSHTASRWLVVLGLLFVLAAGIGGPIWLIGLAETTAQEQAADSAAADSAAADSSDAESVIPDSLAPDTLSGPLPDPGS